MNSQDRLLTSQETADYFGVSLVTLWKMRKNGIIKAIKIRANKKQRPIIRFDPKEIERVARENRERTRKARESYF